MNSVVQNQQHEVSEKSNFIPRSLANIEQSIPEQFQRQVELYSDRLAIDDGDRQLTYDELNCRSNQIAHALLNRRQHIGSEPIALLFDTGAAMVAAMLGVLKAGKFYVPLDVSLPESRLKLILQDCEAQLILSDRHHCQALSSLTTDRDILTIDRLDEFSTQNPNILVRSDDLAYILYTSGSTGKPKGVMQNHRYVLHLCRNYINSGKMTEGDRFSLLYSAAFGGAVRDIYCALLNGAALLPLNVRQVGLHQLGQWLQDKSITVMFVVATLFRHFVATLNGKEQFKQLRLIQIGSETVYRQDAELFQQYFGDYTELMVNLGGTEISPVRQFLVTKDTVVAGATIPAGYEVEGTEVRLWNEDREDVAVGEVGEIVVTGCQVALGYWRKPHLSEKMFVKKGERTYFRTGDLGKLLPDGCLLHLGRKDFQVKIRGYRVETTAVEAALLSLAAVREAVVVAIANFDEEIEELELVAYLTGVGDRQPTAKELKLALSSLLPSYMIPACFIWLESLPLTVTGKVDRRALPEPSSISSNVELAESDLAAPRTVAEQTLVDIWREVLKLERIGIEHNFFNLGGNSLHASRVMTRILERFEINLPLKLMFEAPTIAQFAQFLASPVNSSSLLSADLTNNKHELTLSSAQQRIWFLDRLEANKAVYNLLRGFKLQGEVDVSCLKRAWQTIIDRHTILRTKFEVDNGVPVQKIADSLPFELETVDLRDATPAERNLKLKQTTEVLQNWTFDLTQTPLFKVVLVYLDRQSHQLLMTMHHIISDDWSMQVIQQELSTLYRAFVRGNPSPLAPLPLQYIDYASWQSKQIAAVAQKQLTYWRSQMADAPPLLELPTDFTRTTESNFVADVVPIEIEPEITQKLIDLSKRSQTTLFTTLLTAWSILLARYSSQSNVVVGTSTANRNRLVAEQLIGFFVSTLPLRVKLADNPSFIELLGQVHQTALDAYAYGDVSFDRIVEALNIERHASHHPLFQVMFLLQNVTPKTLVLPEVEVEPLKFNRPTAGATFDLTLSLKETGRGLQGGLEYNVKLFERETIARMVDSLQTLLRAIVATPEQPVGLLPLIATPPISPTQQLISPPEQCLHQWFEATAAKMPTAIAVCYEDQELTYAELNQRANQLAHHLHLSREIKPDTLIGICVERSVEMVVGILGILKAGAAYVPLDPKAPPSRLAYIVRDADLKILVTQADLQERLPQCDRYICLDSDAEAIAACSAENPLNTVKPEHLAYVIYTSGSTGQPKGVLVTHANVVRLFTATESWYNFSDRDVWTQFHSYAFDFSVWELWGALLYGGKLIVVPYWTSRDPHAFYHLLIDKQVTVLNQTPSAFYQLSAVDEAIEAELDLRLVIFGGEALDLANLKPWFERHGDRPQLVNMYGITETTVHVTYRPISLADLDAKDSPIGVSIPDLQIYLLDQYQQPVPQGVRGEMYVGGGGVSRGYLNRKDLTEERFITSPFDPNTKLYKTGDLARLSAQGELVYLGRIDNQVKIRGFRIELGEIEAALSSHPAIRESLVRVCADERGKQIVAYVTCDRPTIKQAEGDVIQEIRADLKQKLPGYMVPNAIVILKEFPLTINGKVDLKALPAPESKLQTSAAYASPQTEVERQIALLWQTLLKIDKVGVKDNFFELGGHSLLLVQLHQQLQSIFTTDLSVIEMFQYPTIEALAQRLSRNSASAIANKDNTANRRDRQSLLKQRKQRRQRHRRED